MKKSLGRVGYLLGLSLPLFHLGLPGVEASNAVTMRTALTCGTDDDGPSLYTIGFVATGENGKYTAYIVNNTYHEARLIGVVRKVFSGVDSSGNTVLSDSQRQLRAVIYKKRNFNAGHFTYVREQDAVSRGFQTCVRNDGISFDRKR